MNPTHENRPQILHQIQVRRARRPVQSVHVTVLQPSWCFEWRGWGIISLKSEASDGKTSIILKHFLR
uniref:Uncharacterized protein n=1 Tax=Heterorhabditis bacteriophora TaxID=37862 RepID=A0A1I7WC85_HETBA